MSTTATAPRYPPFDTFKTEDLGPALEKRMKEHLEAVEAIASNSEAPSFANTLEALEKSGAALAEVEKLFSNLNYCNTNDALQALDRDMSPKLQGHKDSIFLNEKLFARIATLKGQKDSLGLSAEQGNLLDRYHLDFVRAGANVPADKKEELKALNEDISKLETKFSQAVLAEVADSAVWFNTAEELEGMPEEDLEAARKAAGAVEEGKRQGQFLVKLRNTTQQPAMVKLKKQSSRQALLTASMKRGCRGGPHDNTETVSLLAKKRAQRAKLLGFETHSHFVLSDEMAKTPANVKELFSRVAPVAAKMCQSEAAELAEFAGTTADKITAADWDFYTEQLRMKKYSFDDELLKPYFELNRVVVDGLFFSAKKLYGINFTQRTDLPVYDPEVKTYDVTRDDGSKVGILLTDYFARDNKQGGAWMNDYYDQNRLDSQLPVIGNHANFTAPTDKSQPVLLTLDEVVTLFHEFGHGLHGLLSDVAYSRFSGTCVPRDFVEFPSQVNEMWALFPEVVNNYAKHYKTGEPLPAELIEKVRAAEKFNQGYQTAEYCAAALLDLAWHSLQPEEVPTPDQVMAFEKKVLADIGLANPQVPPRYQSTYFSHVFSGGYASGYYAYLWSEVLDADCAEWFKSNGGLTRENGEKLRSLVLSKGGSADPGQMVRDLLGRDASVEPMLKRRNLMQ